ncbi:MAG TPA: LUD domain-containing protein [Nocardioidaceae bacterium]|jgi:L-lactate dehydrogenase complex protein LldG|nr:LUD domain-containing protein [Nocardioidaceae bacterium]
MSAREEILAAVRRAVAPVDGSTERPWADVPRGYRHRSMRDAEADGRAAVLDRFAERVADYRATVVRCTEAELPEAVRGAVGDAGTVLVADGLPEEVAGRLEHVVRDRQTPALELDRVDAVVTGATVGIAETGTIVLTHGPAEGRRAISLVPDVHVCIVRADQVVAGVPEAVALLDPGHGERPPQTWISGPSATSDIELDRVEGVHGPRTLHVLLVG